MKARAENKATEDVGDVNSTPLVGRTSSQTDDARLAKISIELEHVEDSPLEEAVRELASGDRAAAAVSFYFDFGPMARARFEVIRQELMTELKPGSSAPSILIDMLAQLHCAYELWMQRHISAVELGFTPEKLGERGFDWKPPRISDAEALGISGEMVERFSRMFMRALKLLKELQKKDPSVLVQNAEQVNVASQQVNVQSNSK